MSPGLGCGFYSLTDDVNVTYKISKLYGESEEIGIMWNDPDLKIPWPHREPIISKKDQQKDVGKGY